MADKALCVEGREMTDQRSLEVEIRHIRKAISRAYLGLTELAQKGGTGADGHLWQQHHEIAKSLFSESVWVHREDREYVSRDELKAAQQTILEQSMELVDLRNGKRALREIYEEYAGMDGFVPETCGEGYVQHVIKRMADIAGAALGGGE